MRGRSSAHRLKIHAKTAVAGFGPWYYPLKVDSEKRPHDKMRSTLKTGGGFFMAKKGQTFNRYSEETKQEAVRLRTEEGWSYPKIMEKLNILNKSQIQQWVEKSKTQEGFADQRGRWNKTQFASVEEENAYLKAQVEYLKKRNPNLHGEGSWISTPGASPFKK